MSQIIIITGRVGKQPETRKFEKGQLSTFSVAVSEKFKKKDGEKVELTEWFNCVATGATSEVVEKWVNKGDLVQIVGKQRTRKYSKDDSEHTVVELIIEKLIMLGKSGGAETGLKTNQGTTNGPVSEPEEDDLPF